MGESQQIAILTWTLAAQRYACLAAEVQAILEPSDSDAAFAPSYEAHDLDALLGGAASSLSVRYCLRVGREPQVTQFRTGAPLQLETVDSTCFYRLPKLLQETCQPWVRGVVLRSEGPSRFSLGVWLSLDTLARDKNAAR